MDRGEFAGGVLGVLFAPTLVPASFASLEARSRCRIGVAGIDLKSAQTVSHRADERFRMCSTFKLALAMAVLARVDAGMEHLNRSIRFTHADILSHSPLLEAHPGGGSLTVEALLASMVTDSDNGAANLLLHTAGGPPGLTSFVHDQLGISAFRLDRREPALNYGPRSDLRDTASPQAMMTLASGLIVDRVLSPASTNRLIAWLRASTTGLARIRAAVPATWIVGDKTGTAGTSVNDVAIIWRPEASQPIVLAVYVNELTAPSDQMNAVVAAAARRALYELRIG